MLASFIVFGKNSIFYILAFQDEEHKTGLKIQNHDDETLCNVVLRFAYSKVILQRFKNIIFKQQIYTKWHTI